MEWLFDPWPWWVAGVVIGLTVPALLILGNKHFGLSANLRHVCAACFPANVSFFRYDWKREMWNLFFVGGIIAGAFFAAHWLSSPEPIQVAPELVKELEQWGITDYSSLIPTQLISWEALFSLRGFILMVVGGFLVGFGARYAGGCTSGHAIMGLSDLQLPSLIATIFFMVGGFFAANLILPLILSL